MQFPDKGFINHSYEFRRLVDVSENTIHRLGPLESWVISCHRTRCARARKSAPPSVGCKGRSRRMYRGLRAFTAAALVVSACGVVPSSAQKSGGILRVHAFDSPPNLSMHE